MSSTESDYSNPSASSEYTNLESNHHTRQNALVMRWLSNPSLTPDPAEPLCQGEQPADEERLGCEFAQATPIQDPNGGITIPPSAHERDTAILSMKELCDGYASAEQTQDWRMYNETLTRLFVHCTSSFEAAVETRTYLQEDPDVGGNLQRLIVERNQSSRYEWDATALTTPSKHPECRSELWYFNAGWDHHAGSSWSFPEGELWLDICLCLDRMGKRSDRVPDHVQSFGVRLEHFCHKYHVQMEETHAAHTFQAREYLRFQSPNQDADWLEYRNNSREGTVSALAEVPLFNDIDILLREGTESNAATWPFIHNVDDLGKGIVTDVTSIPLINEVDNSLINRFLYGHEIVNDGTAEASTENEVEHETITWGSAWADGSKSVDDGTTDASNEEEIEHETNTWGAAWPDDLGTPNDGPAHILTEGNAEQRETVWGVPRPDDG